VRNVHAVHCTTVGSVMHYNAKCAICKPRQASALRTPLWRALQVAGGRVQCSVLPRRPYSLLGRVLVRFAVAVRADMHAFIEARMNSSVTLLFTCEEEKKTDY